MMEHDDRDVSIGGPYDDVVVIYGLVVEVEASVCFGVLATQYVNDLMPHYTIFNEEV